MFLIRPRVTASQQTSLVDHRTSNGYHARTGLGFLQRWGYRMPSGSEEATEWLLRPLRSPSSHQFPAMDSAQRMARVVQLTPSAAVQAAGKVSWRGRPRSSSGHRQQ